MSETCAAPGCDNDAIAKEPARCLWHLNWIPERKPGEKPKLERYREGGKGVSEEGCRFPGCDKGVFSRGLCSTHAHDPEIRKEWALPKKHRRKPTKEQCRAPECERTARPSYRGLCDVCYGDKAVREEHGLPKKVSGRAANKQSKGPKKRIGRPPAFAPDLTTDEDIHAEIEGLINKLVKRRLKKVLATVLEVS